MRWIRHGNWQLDVEEGDDWKQSLIAVEGRPTDSVSRIRGLRPATDFFRSSDTWWSSVGQPNGFEPYEVDASAVERLIQEAAGMCAEFPETPVPLADSPADRSLKIRLRDFVRTYGPLSEVPGLFRVSRPGLGSGLDDHAPWWSLDADDLLHELREMVDCWELATSAKGERRATAGEVLAEKSALALREVEVIPTFVDLEFEMRVKPLTLRSFAWTVLLERFGRRDRGVCQDCGEDFTILMRPGPVPIFCAKCGSEAARKARSRKRRRRRRPAN